MDKPLGIETRKRLLNRVATDKMMIQAMHFPFPGNGYVVKDGGAYRFVPRLWNHVL